MGHQLLWAEINRVPDLSGARLDGVIYLADKTLERAPPEVYLPTG